MQMDCILECNAPSRKRHRFDSSCSLRVAIIGSGVAGLAAALALQNAGIDAVVYERDSDFNDRKQGYGMTLTNNPTGALAKLGLREECQSITCPSSCHYVFDREGFVKGYYGRYFERYHKNDIDQDSSQRFNLRIPRQTLRDVIYKRLRPGTVRWGWKLTNYCESKDSIDVEFKKNLDNSFETVTVDVLVGCDGIRSVVRHLRDQKLYGDKNIPNPCPLVYIGTTVIIGLSFHEHPLVDSRGFYALDGVHRLFIMPFSGPQIDSVSQKRVTMWQLSFSGLDEEESNAIKNKNPAEILDVALSRVKDWFSPVKDILQDTPLQEVWATPLYDRNPMQQDKTKGKCGSRVVVLGDACHPMSMFKGQGANQAMEDGPLLAKWLVGGQRNLESNKKEIELTPEKIATRLKCFEREMIARTSSKVLASREAAKKLHSEEILAEVFGVEGVDPSLQSKLLERLRQLGITASKSDSLDSLVKGVVDTCTQNNYYMYILSFVLLYCTNYNKS